MLPNKINNAAVIKGYKKIRNKNIPINKSNSDPIVITDNKNPDVNCPTSVHIFLNNIEELWIRWNE
jgi:hypothetical protein